MAQGASLNGPIGEQYANVGPGSYGHLEGPRAGDLGFGYLKLRDHDVARLALNLFSLTGQFVQLLAIDLDSRDHRRNLLLGSEKSCGDGLCFQQTQFRNWGSSDYDTVSVEGVSGLAQLHGSGVRLLSISSKTQESCGWPHGNHQQSRGHGIERAGVTDAALTKDAAHLGNDVVARPTRRFVDEYDAASSAHPLRAVDE